MLWHATVCCPTIANMDGFEKTAWASLIGSKIGTQHCVVGNRPPNDGSEALLYKSRAKTRWLSRAS